MLMWVGIRSVRDPAGLQMVFPIPAAGCQVAGLDRGRVGLVRRDLTTRWATPLAEPLRSHHQMLTTRMGRRRQVSLATRKGFAHLREVTIGSKIRTEEGTAGVVRTGACGFQRDRESPGESHWDVETPGGDYEISFLVEHVVDE
ncbi:hypothetical protein KBK24_0137090 [Burkholderia sp. K24]|nr:hypothetical protein KBK24_0137090 [Burkholderia sp. K24]